MKAVQQPALFHKVQVAFYAILLAEMLRELGVSAMVEDVGEIWHFGEEEAQLWNVTEFRLMAYRRQVIDFFRSHLGRIAVAQVGPDGDASRFHIYFKCEQCNYLSHCVKKIADHVPRRDWDISAIPGMSQYSKQALAEVGIGTLGELTDNPEIMTKPGAGWGLNTRGSRFVKRAKALLTGSVAREPERSTYLLPPKIDATVSLLVDHDPVENRLAALGCLCELPDRDGIFTTAVIAESGADAERQAIWRVLSDVCHCLDEVDAHNRQATGKPWIAHILVYEPSEAADLANALGRHLGDAEIRGGLLHMVRMFPPEPLQGEPEYGGPRHLPATGLRSVFDALYALPARQPRPGPRQPGVGQCRSSLGAPLPSCRVLGAPFSSRLSIEACRGLKLGDTDPALVEHDVRERLRTLADLARWILADNAKASPAFLRLKKAPFRWQMKFHPLDAANLQLLEAQELLNTRIAELAALTALAEPADQRKERSACIGPMRFIRTESSPAGAGWAAVRLHFLVPADCRRTDLGPATFGVVLTDGDPDMLLDTARWPDIAVSIFRIDEGSTNGDMAVKVDVRRDVWRAGVLHKLIEVPRTGADGFYLDRAFFDVNGPRVLNFLQHLEQGGPGT